MATVTLLAVGTTAAVSADFSVVAGTPTYLYAKPTTTLNALPGAYWEIKIMKKTGTDYYQVDLLDVKRPACELKGVGTFQVWRPATTGPVGCDQE